MTERGYSFFSIQTEKAAHQNDHSPMSDAPLQINQCPVRGDAGDDRTQVYLHFKAMYFGVYNL